MKEYAAAITERIGGSLAGVTRTPQDVVELMKGTYEYMIETGMRYAGAKGVPERSVMRPNWCRPCVSRAM